MPTIEVDGLIVGPHMVRSWREQIASLERALAEARAALDEQHAGTDAVWNERHKVTQERDAALALLRELHDAVIDGGTARCSAALAAAGRHLDGKDGDAIDRRTMDALEDLDR